MQVSISVICKEERTVFAVEEGECIGTLLREKSLLAQPCGHGKCGKCRIIANSEACQTEINVLKVNDIQNNIRLACCTKAFEGLEITLLDSSPLDVLTSYSHHEYDFVPRTRLESISIAAPSLEDQRDDMQRVLESANCTEHTLSLKKVIEISEYIHSQSEDFSLAILREGKTLLALPLSTHHLAMSIDIGTTTIAATLIDLDAQKVLAMHGEGNAQASFGADVITRIDATIEESTKEYKNNIKRLQSLVVDQITRLKHKLLQDAGLFATCQDVDYMTITGNTTMMHFLCAMPAKNISRAPFIPVSTAAMRIKAEDIGMNSNAYLYLMPSIASYVGADIVAALLSVNAHQSTEPFILLDLGTNAEIVLGHGGKFVACSAAAGPCFEGASLSCGLPGQSGAINHVGMGEQGSLEFTTINNKQAKGICGSGVLDIIAVLMDCDGMDETGALEEDCEVLKDRFITLEDGQKAVAFTENVYLSQRDIREVQLAKSAIRAGIHALLEHVDLDVSSIKKLYIAGGFGSAMRPESAAKIGLIPSELLQVTVPIGNGASNGAIHYASENNIDQYTDFIVKNSKYLELSALPTFTNLYMEHMIFAKE